jgi:hypothetical protein
MAKLFEVKRKGGREGGGRGKRKGMDALTWVEGGRERGRARQSMYRF